MMLYTSPRNVIRPALNVVERAVAVLPSASRVKVAQMSAGCGALS